jgi:hypothetical protein
MANGKPLSKAEFAALAEIARARRQVTVNMFQGTQLKFGVTSALGTGKSLLSAGNKVRSNVTKLAKGADAATQAANDSSLHQLAEKFIVDCSGVDGVQDIVGVVTSEVTQQLIAEVMPFVGVAVSGVKLASATKTVEQDGYNLYKSDEYAKGFARGDPIAAAEAIQVIIKRDLGRHSVQLAQQATVTGAKIAGLFGDLGTATNAGIALANAIASLGLELVALGLEIKDMRAGNRRLATPATVDITVFEECPILGCYLLTCSDTSTVANMFVADIGLPGWMDKVEKLKKTQMDPLLKIAAKNIQASRLQLEGLQSNKGTHMEKSFFSKVRSKVVDKVGIGKPRK